MDESSATLRDSGLLDRQEVEYVSFLREEEIYSWSSLSLFIPQQTTEDHVENLSVSSRQAPRTTIIQGELLLCYAIFTPEPELIKQFSPVLSMKDDEETKKAKKDPLKRLATIVKHSAFFQNIRFEISFLSITNVSPSAPDISRKTITETEPSHVPQVEPSKAWRIISQQNHTYPSDTELPFVILKTGEIAFPLQFPIAIKKSFENQQIKLRVVVTPVSFPDQQQRRLDGILSYLLHPSATQRCPHQRTANQIVTLLQPLQVAWKHFNTNNTDYVNIFVDNTNNMDVVLQNLTVYSNTTKVQAKYNHDDPLTPATVQGYSMVDHFTFNHQHGQLPIVLSEGDQYSFVVKAQPNYNEIAKPSYQIPGALMAKNVISWDIQTKLKILWSTNDLCSSVISYVPITWNSPKHEDLLISIATKSPAPLNELFDIGFTITNLSREKRMLQLHLNPLWMKNTKKLKKKAKKRNKLSVTSAAPSTCLLCLEKSANIGEIGPYSSTSLNLPFLAIDEGIFQIDKVQILDKANNTITCLADPCEVHVLGGVSSPRNEENK